MRLKKKNDEIMKQKERYSSLLKANTQQQRGLLTNTKDTYGRI